MTSIPDAFAIGLQHHQAGRLLEAEQIYKQIVAVAPEHAHALHLQGVVAAQLGKYDIAIEHIERAIRMNGIEASFHSNLGNAFKSQGKLDKAIASYRRAVELKPDYAEAYNNLGTTLQEQGHLDEAIASCRRAVELTPHYASAHNNLGNALTETGDLNSAIACYGRALELVPNFAEAHYNFGSALLQRGNLEQAILSYRQALDLKPAYDIARIHLGLALMTVGDFATGWPDYETRIKAIPLRTIPRDQENCQWDGSPLMGRRILLCAEQGLGDTLQFIRYAPLVKAYGGHVIVVCQPSLLELLKGGHGIDELIPQPGSPEQTLPPFDVYLYLLSAPKVLRTTLETIPCSVPYLRADERLIEKWRLELSNCCALKVGIAWQGSRLNKSDRRRSIRLSEFERLMNVEGVQYFSLQKGDGSEQLRQSEGRLRVTDFTDRMDESTGPFQDTAAIMKNLDLVITSDTAIAHLAGALGVPVWVALSYSSDWRWLRNRDDSPWYPTMRLFRQNTLGDWAEVFRRLAVELQRLS